MARKISRSKKRRKLSKRQGKFGVKLKLKAEEQEGVTPLVEKYWAQRYDLFSRYDEGIKMDEEGWFSVTPEEIAVRHAQRSGGGLVIDCFTGVGGNAIQFARMCSFVVAIDIDPQKIELASANAKIYGVEDYVDFIIGDFFQLAPSLKGDVAFLAPPWGGPSYKTIENFSLDLLKPKDGYSLFQVAQNITPNIIMFLPRNVDLHQVEELSWLSSPPLNVEIEENYVQSNIKGITVYFGGAAYNTQLDEFKKLYHGSKNPLVGEGYQWPVQQWIREKFSEFRAVPLAWGDGIIRVRQSLTWQSP